MKKTELSIDERNPEEVMVLNSNEKNRSNIQLIVLKLTNWIISYLIIVGLVILYQLFFGRIRYPEILIEIAIVLSIVTTIILYGSATSGMKLVVPGALVVYDKAFLDDINSARARAFNVIGPSVGYVMAVFIYFLFELESI